MENGSHHTEPYIIRRRRRPDPTRPDPTPGDFEIF